MKDCSAVIVLSSETINKTIEIIDRGAMQIALVINAQQQLIGTVTDGDIRRAILRDISFDEPVTKIMNSKPSFLRVGESRAKAISIMRKKKLHHLPVVDANNRLVGMEVIDDILINNQRENYVVIMAGGRGTRLQQLTKHYPKPMLPVGGKPILEYVLDSFIEQGFLNFIITLNYKGEMIEDFFGDGSRWGVNIQYIKEKQRLGTAGALAMLPKDIINPLLVINGDILTKVDFGHLLDFHIKQETSATICVREYNVQVPYGVVNITNNYLQCIQEKPIQRYLVNAGIYVLNPSTLQYIPANTYFDMPSLLNRLIDNKQKIAVFPIREYWIDIGQTEDYERANLEFPEVYYD